MDLLPQNKPMKRTILKTFSVPAAGVTAFFFMMGAITVLLYAAGTVQGFMDSTQLLLLRLAAAWGALLAAASGYGMVLDAVLFVRGRKLRSLGGFLVYLLLGVAGVAVMAAALFIITAAAGNA
jgi:hypothetical protein